MRLKSEFITNSSCASFIIPKKYLTKDQIEMIKDHINVANDWLVGRGPMRDQRHSDEWNIEESLNSIEGDTSMDNFDMMWFLLEIGVDEDHIEHHGCYGN